MLGVCFLACVWVRAIAFLAWVAWQSLRLHRPHCWFVRHLCCTATLYARPSPCTRLHLRSAHIYTLWRWLLALRGVACSHIGAPTLQGFNSHASHCALTNAPTFEVRGFSFLFVGFGFFGFDLVGILGLGFRILGLGTI